MPKKPLSPHNPMATANAMAATGALFYVGCAVLISFSRPVYTSMMSSWYHGINMNALPVAGMRGDSVLVGLLTFTLVSWVAGYAFAYFYNWFASQ